MRRICVVSSCATRSRTDVRSLRRSSLPSICTTWTPNLSPPFPDTLLLMGATSTERFGYTAERGPFRVLLAAIAAVLVVEVPVLFFLLGLVLPPAAALAVLAVLTLAGVVALLLAASPPVTTHRLE